MPRAAFHVPKGEETFCPTCRKQTVIRRKSHGAIPRCDGCLNTSKTGRLTRQREGRSLGTKHDSHRSDSGRRYGSDFSKCHYCKKPFVCHRRGASRKVCEQCLPEHRADILARKRDAAKTDDARQKANAARFRRNLRRVGLPEDFDRSSIQCGVCETSTPKHSKGWSFDHDHECCEKGCSTCFRGFLCGNCNSGLGHFYDNPEALRRAAEWVEKHRVRVRQKR